MENKQKQKIKKLCLIEGCSNTVIGCKSCLRTSMQWRNVFCSQECLLKHMNKMEGENMICPVKEPREKKYKLDIVDGELSVKNIAKVYFKDGSTANMSGCYGNSLDDMTFIDYSGQKFPLSTGVKAITMQGDLLEEVVKAFSDKYVAKIVVNKLVEAKEEDAPESKKSGKKQKSENH